MVYVVNGKVHPGRPPSSTTTTGVYERKATVFHGTIAQEGALETPGRLHLVICSACPWACRALLVKELKDLSTLSVSIVSPLRDDDVGWTFATDEEIEKYKGVKLAPTKDLASGKNFRHLHELYTLSDSHYTGNITTPIPILFDSQTEKIINNESWEVARLLDGLSPGPNAVYTSPLYPESHRKEIDDIAMDIQVRFNNGVYKCGMAGNQAAYDEAVSAVFECLEEMEERLSGQRYLLSLPYPTIADWQFFVSLIRFDDVYFPLFKCTKRRIRSLPNLFNYTKELYQIRRVSDTVSEEHIVLHYFHNFTSCNPNGVIPQSTSAELHTTPHDRDRFNLLATTESAVAVEEDQTNKAKRQATGEFVRGVSAHRNIITANGAHDSLPAESGRYHLYVANNCPWCHRVMLARHMLSLEDVISVDVMFYRRNDEKGWQFLPPDDELRPFELEMKPTWLEGTVATVDSVQGFKFIREIYAAEGSKEKSVPVLFDKKTKKIVNNESAEIVRMFELGFKAFHKPSAPDLYPASLASLIDATNSWVYEAINNGAYKAGFSSKQEVHNVAIEKYFSAWDRIENTLEHSQFLCGDKVTEADLRLYPTIVRHDPVYYSRMKLNRHMVLDYKNLHRWLRQMNQVEGVEAATNIDHCRLGYFGRTGNGIIPINTIETSWY